jgi:hypothetical protein
VEPVGIDVAQDGRYAHYIALLETVGARRATKVHVDDREQLMADADVLLFGDPDIEQDSPRRST